AQAFKVILQSTPQCAVKSVNRTAALGDGFEQLVAQPQLYSRLRPQVHIVVTLGRNAVALQLEELTEVSNRLFEHKLERAFGRFELESLVLEFLYPFHHCRQ